MTSYDYLELLKALRMCVSKPHFHVGVFTPTVARAKSILEDAHTSIVEDDEEHDAMQRRLSSPVEQLILFKNGSYIRCVPANENSRGNKFHHILYTDHISHDVLRVIVKPTQTKYMEEDNGTSG